ncbi:MAG: hypothetical protein ABIK82_16595 [Pseudomonadota bacterium]
MLMMTVPACRAALNILPSVASRMPGSRREKASTPYRSDYQVASNEVSVEANAGVIGVKRSGRTLHEIERIKALRKSVAVNRSIPVAAFQPAAA